MYDDLIKRLRRESECPDNFPEDSALFQEAADAIEKLTQKEKFHSFLWNVINPNEMEQYLEMYRSQEVPQMNRNDGHV